MTNHKLVLPEFLNQYGFLFGGYLLKWVDEYAWIAATLDFPACNFVTIAMDKVEFRRTVRQGVILQFEAFRERTGRTSADYRVVVEDASAPRDSAEPIFSTLVTLVRVDADGCKLQLSDS
ncbi:MAG: acyl-CoA thioesterase [Pirellulaceae bacterium]